MNKIKKFIKNPFLIFLTLGHREFFNFISDERYLKIAYRISMNKKLNLDNPITFTEKIQWLKLHDRKPFYSSMVDKFEAKSYAANLIGDKYIIKTLGIWNNFDDIDFDSLPTSFVLKCTHDSGGSVIVKNKNNFNKKMAKKKINNCLKHSFYWGQREWPYKNIKPRIIAEEYIEDDRTGELRDYKFFTFDGKVKLMFVASGRQSNNETTFDFYDTNFNHLNIINGHPNSNYQIEKPQNFNLMIELAEKMSKNFKHLRVDFYEANGQLYFGEFTFYHWSGFTPFEPELWDVKLGSYIDISIDK